MGETLAARALAASHSAGRADRGARLFAHLARGAAMLAVVLGVAVLFGWARGVAWLEDPLLGFVPMSPNTAVLFVVVAAALAASTFRSPARPRGLRSAVLALATFAVAYSAATLDEAALGVDLGVARMFVPHPAQLVSPATAVTFVLLGAALIVLDARARRGMKPSEILAFLALVPGSLTIGAYVFGAFQFYTSGRHPLATGMAIHSAIGLVVLSLGVLAARVESGLMAVVASPHVGGRVVRRVLAIVGAIPLVGFAAVLGQRAGLYASPGSSVVATVASMILATVVALALGRSLDASDDLRRRTEDELRQWKQFFDGASFGAVVGGVDRRFRHVNEAFARMHGFTVAELEGTPIADIFAPHRREELERCIEITHRAGHCRWTSDHLRKDGSVFPVLIDLTAIRDADGQVIYRAASVQDITEETRAEAVRARLAALVESADDAIVAKTLDATVLAWNRGAERVFGWTAEEMIGRSIDIVVPDDRRAERERMCAAMLSGERVVSFETIRVRKDGRRIPIALTTSPIRDGAGRVIGVSTIERDISAIKKLEREREEWTSVVAHDLRQPATAIRIAAGVLDRTEGAARAKAVARIRHASVRLDRMIEDLLDASRTAASRLSIRSDRVSVADVFEDAIGQLPDAAPRCEVHLDPRCPDAIGDTGRLVQVLSNLLSNAAKYGYPDSPIELRAERSGDMVELSVTNEGPGIAADEIPRLFSRFARTFAAQRSTTPGLGLGLYICRGLVEAHGGRLWVESTPGETTSFRFTIPAADRAEARPVM